MQVSLHRHSRKRQARKSPAHGRHDLKRSVISHQRGNPHWVSVPSKNIHVKQTSLAIEAAIVGQGLALTSLFFVEDDLAAGPLVRLFATELRVGADFYIASPREPRDAA